MRTCVRVCVCVCEEERKSKCECKNMQYGLSVIMSTTVSAGKSLMAGSRELNYEYESKYIQV